MENVVGVMITQSLPIDLAKISDPISIDSFYKFILVINRSGTYSETEHGNICLIETGVNLGGAGGFELGIRKALEFSPQWVWTTDDDARAEKSDLLSVLVEHAKKYNLDLCSPLIVEPENQENLSFPYGKKAHRIWKRSETINFESISNQAHLFNGTLFRSSILNEIGLPIREMFIRGDEQEYLMRFKKNGNKIATCTGAAMIHPGGSRELYRVFPGILRICIPNSDLKFWFQIRNRGFNTRVYKKFDWALVDFYRYCAFFFFRKKPMPRTFVQVLKIYMFGFKKNLNNDLFLQSKIHVSEFF